MGTWGHGDRVNLNVIGMTDRQAWAAALLALPQPHVLQSWAWGETKTQTGWRARRLLWQGDEQPVAAAALLIRRLHARLPISVAYVPKGPILDWSDAALVEAVLDRIEAEARRAGAIFVKIDPDVHADTAAGEAVIAALARRGWRPSGEQIQYRNTVVSDLTPSEDALLAAMKPKWRYNIRLAERKGVVVRDGTAADLPAFYAMYAETGGRDGFLVRPFDYYRAIWERFLADGMGHVLLAEVDGAAGGRPVPVPLRADRMVFLRRVHGSKPRSDAQLRAAMGGDALGQGGRLRALRLVGRAGCAGRKRPDVGRLPVQTGVRRRVHAVDRRVDFATNRAAYWGYTVAMPKVLDAMRRRHRGHTVAGVATTGILPVDNRKMVAKQRKLTDFFRESPFAGLEIDLSRAKGGSRPDIA